MTFSPARFFIETVLMCTTKSHTDRVSGTPNGDTARQDLLLEAKPYSLSYQATILAVRSSSMTEASASMIELSVELR